MKKRQQLQPLHQQPLRRSQRIGAQSSPTLLDALHPVISILLSLISDDDAARVLRTSRTAALTPLPGNAFASHIFTVCGVQAAHHSVRPERT